MGKLIIFLLALVIILVILPGDIRSWMVTQLDSLMAGVSDPGQTLPSGIFNSVENFDMNICCS